MLATLPRIYEESVEDGVGFDELRYGRQIRFDGLQSRRLGRGAVERVRVATFLAEHLPPLGKKFVLDVSDQRWTTLASK